MGGQTRERIAALDAGSGAATPWDPEANGEVDALAVSGETIYAGGAFTTIGGSSRLRIAALPASHATATAWNPEASDAVDALAFAGRTLYAGGAFAAIGGQPQWPRLARFSPLPSPRIGALRPSRGAVGATLTITGSGFGASRGGARVFFGSKAAMRYVLWSATKIEVVPALGAGRTTVTVRTAAGKSNAKGFKVLWSKPQEERSRAVRAGLRIPAHPVQEECQGSSPRPGPSWARLGGRARRSPRSPGSASQGWPG